MSRYLVVGGAGSLEVAPGGAGDDAGLDRLGREKELNWNLLSPSTPFDFGSRTGKFHLGGDRLLVDSAGKSRALV